MSNPTWPDKNPIYYVVVEQEQDQYYMVYRILESIPCNMSDIDQMFATHVLPPWNSGRRVSSMIFRREPPNPVQEASMEATPKLSDALGRLRLFENGVKTAINAMRPNQKIFYPLPYGEDAPLFYGDLKVAIGALEREVER